MNFELAKKLKDAGFSQLGDGIFQREDDEPIYLLRTTGEEQLAKRPTLLELIEACGTYLSLQSPDYLENEEGYWRAIGKKENRCTSFGKSPEEAVARLWLALNAPPSNK